MNRDIVIIGGRYDVCDRARTLGLNICLVQKPALLDKRALALADRAIITDYASDPTLLPALQAMHETSPFAALISLTEPGLLVAAEFAERLGVPGMPSPIVVSRTTDKHVMRHRLAEHFPAANIAFKLCHSADEAVTFGETHGWPIIVKPRDGTGSRGVQSFATADSTRASQFSDVFLCESFVAGTEFSVEAFSFAGRHVIYAITAKSVHDASTVNPFVELAHRMPADLDEDSHGLIVDTVLRLLNTLEIRDGPTHTEVKLTPDGTVKIIETHTRYGGDHIAEMVRLVTGSDLISMALGWPVGLVSPPVGPIRATGGAAVEFIIPPVGVIADIYGVDAARGAPGIHLVQMNVEREQVTGEVVRSGQRAGFVVAVGASSLEAAKVCSAAVGAIKVVAQPQT